MTRGMATGAAMLLLAGGCTSPAELRLLLAEASPDPLADATDLRLEYDPGDGSRVAVTIPLDGGSEPGMGISADVIRDLRLDALDGHGEVVARGWRDGDVTPGPDEPLEVEILLLAVGTFSTVEGLRLQGPRTRPCVVAAPGRGALIAGGGRTSVELLDALSGRVEDGGVALSSPADGCRAALLDGGIVALAGRGSGDVDLVDLDGATLVMAADTGRADGALAAVDGGALAWWMGGPDDGADLTSEILVPDRTAPAAGPVVPGTTRSGHGVVCAEEDDGCVVFGSSGEPAPWWRVAGSDVAEGEGGLTLEPLVHEDEPLAGSARDGAALGGADVIALLDDGATTTAVVFDVSNDGTILLEYALSPPLRSPALAVAADGQAWLVGGAGSAGCVAGVVQVVREGGDYVVRAPDLGLSTPRSDAGAAVLDGGRIVVVGGVDGDGEALSSIEIYQP